VEALAFPESTGYLEVPAGTYDFAVSAAGGTPDAAVLNVDDLALMEGVSYTAVAYDQLASIKALALVDDSAGIPEGQVRVRAIHTASGIGEVDIWNIPAEGAPAPLVEDLGFGEASAALDIPAAAYLLGIDVDDDASPDLTFQTPPLSAGLMLNVFAVKDGEAIYLLGQLPDGSTVRIDPMAEEAPARIRVLHLSPDAPAVDVFANGAPPAAVSALEFPNGTAYLEVPAGEYDFQVAVAGDEPANAVLTVPNLMLEAGGSYTAVAYDAVAQIKALGIMDDYDAIPEGSIRVRAIHAAAGVGQVDIWNIPEMGDPAPLVPDFDFGAMSPAVDLPAGSYTLGVDVDDDATPDLTFTTPSIPAGTLVNLYAVKDAVGVFLLAQLPDGSTLRIDP
jgi:hypothetical protein